MDQSGSPRWLVASDSGQASTVRAVATCRIPAAGSSDWEARAGVEKTAEDGFVVNQPSECSPGSIEGSSNRQDPEDSNLIGSSSAGGRRGATGVVVRQPSWPGGDDGRA